MSEILKIELTIEKLREMERAGGGALVVEIQDEESGETTQVTIQLPLTQIQKMIAIQEGAERAMRN